MNIPRRPLEGDDCQVSVQVDGMDVAVSVEEDLSDHGGRRWPGGVLAGRAGGGGAGKEERERRSGRGGAGEEEREKEKEGEKKEREEEREGLRCLFE